MEGSTDSAVAEAPAVAAVRRNARRDIFNRVLVVICILLDKKNSLQEDGARLKCER
jgi:hypothetical protein